MTNFTLKNMFLNVSSNTTLNKLIEEGMSRNPKLKNKLDMPKCMTHRTILHEQVHKNIELAPPKSKKLSAYRLKRDNFPVLRSSNLKDVMDRPKVFPIKNEDLSVINTDLTLNL